jgi:hypothetical protein
MMGNMVSGIRQFSIEHDLPGFGAISLQHCQIGLPEKLGEAADKPQVG